MIWKWNKKCNFVYYNISVIKKKLCDLNVQQNKSFQINESRYLEYLVQPQKYFHSVIKKKTL